MKRFIDIITASALLLTISPVLLLIAVLIKLTSRGPVLYWSDRIGKDNRIFGMPKFRTMKINTPVVATHLLREPDQYLTPIGRFLRKSSIDELPQLFSIIWGDMSLVGPRPALFNQLELIELRTRKGIHRLFPGITGWAQINGRDELPIPVKVELDEYYLRNCSLSLDMQIVFQTVSKVLRSEGIKH